MKSPLSPEAREILRRLEKSFHDLLDQAFHQDATAPFPESELFLLKSLFLELSHFEDVELRKCAELADHLTPEMSERHFLNLLIPIERLLGRDLKDGDFLVTHADRNLQVSRQPLYFILENLRSSFNVGSIFRLADGLAVEKIYLCGYTPGPEADGVGKTAMGTTETVPFIHYKTSLEAIRALKSEGVEIVGLETAGKAQPLFQYEFQKTTALLVGNERFGLDPKSLALCDALVELPLKGMKNSLNVATALSGAAFEWTRQASRSNPSDI